ncbi:MAG TPA: hypothetical protein VFV34_27090, partial [Blastocatellia bacterium]|nr:hypothetical protein [Blastocatellia bacterium]
MKTRRLFSIVAILALCLTSVTLQTRAQQPVSQSTNPNDTRRGWSDLQFKNLVAQVRPSKRVPFFLTSESGYANAGGAASSIAPAAAGPSLPVIGGGTLGRLTKWTGFT